MFALLILFNLGGIALYLQGMNLGMDFKSALRLNSPRKGGGGGVFLKKN